MAKQMDIQQAIAMNAAKRQLVLNSSQSMKQQIYSVTQATPGSTQNVFNIPIRNVGLVTGFIVCVTATLANAGGSNATLTTIGGPNILSNITFTDLDQYQRINCAGWFMAMTNASKEGSPFGAALLSTAWDQTSNFGNNFDVATATATLTSGGGTGTIKQYYWVPLAYSTRDLRGAMYAGVVNATSQLQLTVNPTPGVASGDATLACYSGASTTVTISSVSLQVYQCYQDQLPRDPRNGAPILPDMDIATQYRLVTTSLTGMSAGQDFPIPFSNFQDFLSCKVIYDQNGTLSDGSDINYWSLQAANTLNFFKIDPYLSALLSRVRNRTDYPRGIYDFDFRDSPISTNQTGNMQLILNPITAAASSQVLVGFESFALVNAVLGAGSLPAG